MSNEAADGAAQQVAPAKHKLSWGEKRDRRRRRRLAFEEILGWILVPAILYGAYLVVQAMGGIPPAAIDFLHEVVGSFMSSRG
jgi:hypothetical protein